MALFISAVSLYMSWRQFDRDRSWLKLGLEFHLKSGRGSSYSLKIVNIGRRPVTIIKCYARLKSGKAYPVYDRPTILNETNNLNVDIPLYDFRSTIIHPLDIVAFEVEESTGKLSRIMTRRIGRDVRKLWTPDVDWLNKHWNHLMDSLWLNETSLFLFWHVGPIKVDWWKLCESP